MKVFSDEVSELYRKYIIELKLPAKQSLFLLWGTDSNNEDEDYLMLNPENKILVFPKIKELLHYVKTTGETLKDAAKTRAWARDYKANRSYTSYDIEELITLMENSDKPLENYTKEEAIETSTFCSLFSDYAYQLKQEELIRLYHDEDLAVFQDWVNAQYLWKPDEDYLAALTDQLKKIDDENIKTIIRKMYRYFIENIVVVKAPDY